MFQVKINKNIDFTYTIIQSHLRMKCNKRLSKMNWRSYDNKLLNNIARAKTNCFNIVLNNKFTFFFTQTIDSKFARTDLNQLINKFRYYNKQLRKLYKEDFYYLIIPEYHKDKKNWHLHGFLSSAYGLDSYINKNGFLSVSALDNIGFNSISKIKNYTACCKYILKYITKETALTIKKGEHFYYCSKNLSRQNICKSFASFEIAPIHFDFKNEYVFKTTIDKNKYYNFIKSIDDIDRFHYYNFIN